MSFFAFFSCFGAGLLYFRGRPVYLVFRSSFRDVASYSVLSAEHKAMRYVEPIILGGPKMRSPTRPWVE